MCESVEIDAPSAQWPRRSGPSRMHATRGRINATGRRVRTAAIVLTEETAPQALTQS